jgi:hypothetical protein
MAAGNFTLYNASKAWFFDGTFDWDTDNHYCELLKSGYTPAATHDTWSDVSAQVVVTGTQSDYAAQLLAGEAVNGGTATATGNCDATNESFGTNVSLTARYAVIRTGPATATANHKLVGYVSLDTATDVSSTNGNFEIQWHANGLWTFA